MPDYIQNPDRGLRPAWLALFCFALLLSVRSGSAQLKAKATQQTSLEANQSTPVEVQNLMNRVSMLEQKLADLTAKVAADETNGVNDVTEPTAEAPAPMKPPSDAGAGSKSSLDAADQARLTKMEAQIGQLSSEVRIQVNRPANRYAAPFQVVDSKGAVILDVEDGLKDGDFRGLRVKALNGSFAQIGGAGADSYPNIGVYLAGKDSPRIAMGLHTDGRPAIAINSVGTGRVSAELTEDGGGGEMTFRESGGQIVLEMGADPQTKNGYAQYNSPDRGVGVQIGVMGQHGDVAMVGHEKSFSAWAQFILGSVPRL